MYKYCMCRDTTTPTMKFENNLGHLCDEPETKYVNEIPYKSRKYIKLLENEAFMNEGIANAKIAAGIVFKGRLISIGYNSKKTHPLQAKFGKNENAIFVHAEIDAIRKAVNILSSDQLKKCTMIVVRVKKDGSWGLARPCVHKNGQGCQNAIYTFGIKEVVYSTGENGKVAYL